MDDTPIFASVERDLNISYGALAAGAPEDETTPAGSAGDPADRLDRRWRKRWHQPDAQA